MKLQHIWSVLCKESVISQEDNTLSIFGVLEELTVFVSPVNESETLPEKFGVPINYEIVSMWQKDKAVKSLSAEVEYTFFDSEGQELFKNTQRFEIPDTSKRFRSRMKLTGMPLSKAGDYTFRIRIKEEGTDTFQLVTQIPLEVRINLENSTVKHN